LSVAENYRRARERQILFIEDSFMLKEFIRSQTAKSHYSSKFFVSTDIRTPQVSVVIPALNEAERLPGTLRALRTIREREYPKLEIVVGVGPSFDQTEAIARELGDVVVNVGLGPSRARNEAARVASGDIIVFLDADAKPLPGAIRRIADCTSKNVVGTCTMRPDVVNWKSIFLTLFKNFVRCAWYPGCSELIFCHREVFITKKVQFNEQIRIGELREFFSRAIKYNGAQYRFLYDVQYESSVRRYEEVGYFRVALFWLLWRILNFLPAEKKRLESEYWASRFGKA